MHRPRDGMQGRLQRLDLGIGPVRASDRSESGSSGHMAGGSSSSVWVKSACALLLCNLLAVSTSMWRQQQGLDSSSTQDFRSASAASLPTQGIDPSLAETVYLRRSLLSAATEESGLGSSRDDSSSSSSSSIMGGKSSSGSSSSARGSSDAFSGSAAVGNNTSAVGGAVADTLVVYIYSATDPEYEHNLRHFLRVGVKEGDGCDYVFILQQTEGLDRSSLPDLPPNARYVPHANECFDWGSFGWAVESGHAHPERYKHVIVMNSSVRGPFLPVHWPRVHWSRVLTSRLNDEVKLVGPTISCEGMDATESRPARKNPHVQSYVVAMDQVGYRLLRDSGTVLGCYTELWDVIFHAELGSSAAVLGAGYSIDSLMLRYQGVDWTDKANWGCNGGINPYLKDQYDGINLSPLEVMFVKVKEHMLQGGWEMARTAARYGKWSAQRAANSRPLVENDFLEHLHRFSKKHNWNMRLHDPNCFDADYYARKNAELQLPPFSSAADAFNHFVMHGQWAGAVWRFRCDRLLEHDPATGAPIAEDNWWLAEMYRNEMREANAQHAQHAQHAQQQQQQQQRHRGAGGKDGAAAGKDGGSGGSGSGSNSGSSGTRGGVSIGEGNGSSSDDRRMQ